MDGNFKIHQDAGDLDKARKRGIKLILIVFVVVMLFSFGTTLLQIYTDWMWFTHDAQQPEVFNKTIQTKLVLWGAGLLVSFFFIFLNARKALSSETVFDSAPSDENSRTAANILTKIQKFARVLAFGVAIVVAFGMASNLSSAYREYWAFSAGVPFGTNDPLFGLDYGFFVFQLPWYMTVANTILSIMFMTLIVTLGGYFGSRALAGVAKAKLAQGPMRLHISILGGLTIIAFGARMFLTRYMLGVQSGVQFTGPGFAQSQVIKFYALLGVLTMIVGILTMLNAKLWKPWKAPAFGLPVVILLGVVLLGVYPGMIQQLKVEKNLLSVEKPYAVRAIESTRFAFGIDDFNVKEFTVQDEPTAAEVAASQSTLESMRLWDPEVLKRVFHEKQTLRKYYEFYDVDIDRYMVDGKQRMVMLSPRDISYEGVDQRNRNWQNQHLRYTHGFGLVMTPANEAILTGEPNYWIKNLPPNQGDKFQLDEQRMYFSHFGASSVERSGYLLLQSELEEFDYPAETDQLHNWQGTRGVPIDGPFARFAYSTILSEFGLYTTDDITSGTKIVYNRDILDRARLIYPFLKFDVDPYIVLHEGRIKWVADAYTVTDNIPYSAFVSTPQGTINYMRNSVKLIIDAYDGTMNAYAIEPDEPILKTWMGVFPGLIRPAAEIPAGMVEHFRYAEGLFSVQANILSRYHVTDPVRFLSNDDAWQISREKGLSGSEQEITPYFVQMRLPGSDVDEFMLILPFNPYGKENMIGWIAAHCDPAQYGKVELFKFPKDTQTQGPALMEAKFDQDPIVADINKQFNSEQTSIVPGNMLVIPIGSSLLYVKPLFLQSRARAIPELRKVILGLQNRVVVGDTYEEALQKLFGNIATSPVETGGIDTDPNLEPGQPDVATGDIDPVLQADIAEVARLLDAADAALRAGDFAKFGDLQKQARDKLRGLAK